VNKGVLASLAGAVFCLLAGQPVMVVFCLILAWVARSARDAVNAATTHEQNDSAFLFWSLVWLFVVFLIMAYGGMMTMVDPDAKFVADDALLRALLEN
jgi:uncharacterized membrane protein